MRLHRRIGLALETLYRSDPEPHLAELAPPLRPGRAGGDVAKAIAYARRAGERAMALLAFEDAAVHVELGLQAIDLLDAPDEALRCDLLLTLAAAQMNAGDVTTGRETYMRAANLAKAAGLPEQLARAALGFGGEPIVAWGFDAELVRVLEAALDLLGPEDRPVARAAADTSWQSNSTPSIKSGWRRCTEDAEAMARRLGDARSLAVALIGRAHVQLGLQRRRRVPHRHRPRDGGIGEALGDRGVMWSASCARICGLLLDGDMATVDREIDVAARIAEESRQPFYLFWTPTLYGMRALMDGRFADAESPPDRGALVCSTSPPRPLDPVVCTESFRVAARAGAV